MRFRKWTSFFYFLSLWAQVIVGFLVVCIGAAQRADSGAIRTQLSGFPELAELIDAAQRNAWWQLPVFTIAAGVLGLLRKQLGSPWLWDAVKFSLDEIQKIAFTMGDSDGQHHHRVTLFKYVPWAWCLRRWPWSGWLVPVERSGHTTRSGVSYFKAPDAADQAEGIAGLTWARRRTVGVSDLPELTAQSSNAELQTYATSTGLSIEQVKDKLPKARSFAGIPVEVGGRVWGVIVLDSRGAKSIRGDVTVIYQPISRVMGKLLEKL